MIVSLFYSLFHSCSNVTLTARNQKKPKENKNFAEQIFAIELISTIFTVFNFSIWDENRENKFSEACSAKISANENFRPKYIYISRSSSHKSLARFSRNIQNLSIRKYWLHPESIVLKVFVEPLSSSSPFINYLLSILQQNGYW